MKRVGLVNTRNTPLAKPNPPTQIHDRAQFETIAAR
jgi:hypothetical protein